MSEKPKVLIVEDEAEWQRAFQRGLERRGAEVLVAGTIEDAERLFAEHPDIQIIMMDACVPGDRPTTVPLVRKFRQTFAGPIIAMSSRTVHSEQLVQAGCSHQSLKWDVLDKVKQLLELS